MMTGEGPCIMCDGRGEGPPVEGGGVMWVCEECEGSGLESDRQRYAEHDAVWDAVFDEHGLWDGEERHPDWRADSAIYEAESDHEADDDVADHTLAHPRWKEETGFTTGEPMDIAWRLLKGMCQYDVSVGNQSVRLCSNPTVEGSMLCYRHQGG